MTLNHLDDQGQARMVDVSQREVTARSATAEARVLLNAEVVSALRDGTVPKGDVLAAARIAAIMGAKRTPDVIPMCHPIALHGVTAELTIEDAGVYLLVTAKTADRTGVEMEALTAAAIGALTVVDMVKSMDPKAEITGLRLLAKDGGRSGSWVRQ